MILVNILRGADKECTSCGRRKPLVDFGHNRTHRDGRSSDCLECQNKKSHAYYQANRESILAVQRGDYQSNPGKYRTKNQERYRRHRDTILAKTKRYAAAHREQIRDRRLRSAYGIGLDDYNRMLGEQNGRCGICGTDDPGSNARCRSFMVDHDHNSGAVRGLLCNRCNRVLGLLGDEPSVLRSAIDYLSKNGGHNG